MGHKLLTNVSNVLVQHGLQNSYDTSSVLRSTAVFKQNYHVYRVRINSVPYFIFFLPWFLTEPSVDYFCLLR